ncbi:MAG: putative toxin-antitoxin system toxin component, PIN family [Candidatus Micrarchaeia archaeon]
MLKVTLDTNILVSGTFWEGEAFKIIQLIEQKKIECYLSKAILEEYNKVLHSEEILEKVSEHHLKIKSAIIKVIEICSIVDPKTRIVVVDEDPDDNKILECAVEAKVNYIVSYDEHLLKLKEFEGIKIVLPKELLKIV